MSESKQVGIVCCSNGLSLEQRDYLERTKSILENQGYQCVMSPYIYKINQKVSSGTPQQRAEVLMTFFNNPSMQHIFDVSGGDLANEVLTYLNYDEVEKSQGTFWGYSDLTTIINAIYSQAGKSSVLYQVRHTAQVGWQEKLFDWKYTWIQGENVEGIVVGGNIRCLLKLAGTPYFPDMTDKILLLEACGGEVPQVCTYLNQLQQIGVFKQIKGIILGTFTALEKNKDCPSIENLVQSVVGHALTIVKTPDIGHGITAKAIKIGECVQLKKQ